MIVHSEGARGLSLRIVFMGTPEYALPSLARLYEEGYDIALIVTQPDKPVGRKRMLTPPPVKTWALERGLPVFQPKTLRTSEAWETLFAVKPDLIVTAAYGKLLPDDLLRLPRYGALNLHASLLPAYRGAAPIQRAILDGCPQTGVTLMEMVRDLDAGPIIAKRAVPIAPKETTGTLTEKLARVAADLLIDVLPDYVQGRIRPVPQDETRATYAEKLTREDEMIDLFADSVHIDRQIRALLPAPGGYMKLGPNETDKVKIWSGEAYPSRLNGSRPTSPGTIIAIEKERVAVATGDGVLWLEEVQPAGKKRMTAAEWVRGRASWKVGSVLVQKDVF